MTEENGPGRQCGSAATLRVEALSPDIVAKRMREDARNAVHLAYAVFRGHQEAEADVFQLDERLDAACSVTDLRDVLAGLKAMGSIARMSEFHEHENPRVAEDARQLIDLTDGWHEKYRHPVTVEAKRASIRSARGISQALWDLGAALNSLPGEDVEIVQALVDSIRVDGSRLQELANSVADQEGAVTPGSFGARADTVLRKAQTLRRTLEEAQRPVLREKVG